MHIPEQIEDYINSQPEQKRNDMQALHRLILEQQPACKLWFLEGKYSEGKIVSNPNIGYGLLNINYADGTTKPFYQIGMSANTTGISVYIMGIKDKTYLAQTYGEKLAKGKCNRLLHQIQNAERHRCFHTGSRHSRWICKQVAFKMQQKLL